jgi:hypothetical protein
VDVVLGDGQRILSVLQPCTGVIKEVGLDIAAMVRPHELVVQRLVLCLKMMVLLEVLSVPLLDVLDGVVLLLHPVVVLFQAHTLEGTSRHGLLMQGAHVLGITCGERPICVVRIMLGVANGGQALAPNYVDLIPDGGKTTAVPSRPGRWC